jgi:hypothetical protein
LGECLFLLLGGGRSDYKVFLFEFTIFCVKADLSYWIGSCLLAAYTPVFVYIDQSIAGGYNDNARDTLQLNLSINWE